MAVILKNRENLKVIITSVFVRKFGNIIARLELAGDFEENGIVFVVFGASTVLLEWIFTTEGLGDVNVIISQVFV